MRTDGSELRASRPPRSPRPHLVSLVATKTTGLGASAGFSFCRLLAGGGPARSPAGRGRPLAENETLDAPTCGGQPSSPAHRKRPLRQSEAPAEHQSPQALTPIGHALRPCPFSPTHPRSHWSNRAPVNTETVPVPGGGGDPRHPPRSHACPRGPPAPGSGSAGSG